ncbi:MAG: hypothetical protein PHT07_02645 [Paludibacter sp.]|nr:hypothetical protein [Paludibacter sp.]
MSVQFKIRQPISTIRSKTYSVICLSILMFYVIRPVLPFVEYAINKDYIAKNLCINKDKPLNCCQGKCYLNEELKKSAQTQESNSDNTKKTVPDLRMEDHLKAELILVLPVEKAIKLNCYFPVRIIVPCLSAFFVPPKN